MVWSVKIILIPKTMKTSNTTNQSQ